MSKVYNSEVIFKYGKVELITQMEGGNLVSNQTVKKDLRWIEEEIRISSEQLKSNQAKIERNKESIEQGIKKYSELLIYKESGIKYEDTETYRYLVAENERMEKDNEALEKEIAELERQKAELSGSK